ncbi:HalOD1 output domain-containing protein [Haloferax sp. S1W]|uniref:HalOD1 output domain-containing protein n=1 Tax=Haloferax sp. S1W TaxID=3377110 RepID=UPI0037CBB180
MDDARVIQGSDAGWNTGTTDEVVARHDWDGRDTLAVTIVTATAQALAVDELELPPLADTVSPGALHRLFHPAGGAPMSEAPTESGNKQPSRGRVRFRYASCDVTVWADGTVIVAPSV